jgi:hypothetical protein
MALEPLGDRFPRMVWVYCDEWVRRADVGDVHVNRVPVCRLASRYHSAASTGDVHGRLPTRRRADG